VDEVQAPPRASKASSSTTLSDQYSNQSSIEKQQFEANKQIRNSNGGSINTEQKK